MQLCFVSVHGPRETYFVDEPRNSAFQDRPFINGKGWELLLNLLSMTKNHDGKLLHAETLHSCNYDEWLF
jgi:hypothetical protein